MSKAAPFAKLRCALLAAALATALAAVMSGTANTAATTKRYALRGVYDRDFSATGFDDEARIGFNLIDTNPYRYQTRALAARGLKGLIWLGGYSNTSCTFNESDAWVRSHVAAIAPRRHRGRRGRHRRWRKTGVGAYLIDDEPDAAACPGAPAQMKARSDLIDSIDSRTPTLIVTNKEEQLKLFAGKVDIIGLDHYPCSFKNGCNYSIIDRQAAQADRLGIRYWGVIQAHGDDWYRVPSPEELHRQFVHWRATNMKGYLVFAWHWPDSDPSRWLANNPDLQAQLAIENAR